MKKLIGHDVKKVFLTGGAGFIGSHICDKLLSEGYYVSVYDNLSNGRLEFIKKHLDSSNFILYEEDCLDAKQLVKCMYGHDLVWHMAANTDIISSHKQPDRDLKDCAISTFNVLEAMRINNIQPLLFASSGAVYGDLCLENIVDETAGPLAPLSTYAAGKISSEAFISSYCHLFNLRSWIFRLGNVIGSRVSHGVIFDFIDRLRKNPSVLKILGDGMQEKNYFLTEDCIDGMGWAFRNICLSENNPCGVFNLGAASVTGVQTIAAIVIEEMGLQSKVKVEVEGSKRAWVGDQPRVHISVEKMRGLGWSCPRSSDEAVLTAVRRVLGKE